MINFDDPVLLIEEKTCLVGYWQEGSQLCVFTLIRDEVFSSELLLQVVHNTDTVPVLVYKDKQHIFKSFWINEFLLQIDQLHVEERILEIVNSIESDKFFFGVKVIGNLAMYGLHNLALLDDDPAETPPSCRAACRVFIAILSRGESVELRATIRSTWLPDLYLSDCIVEHRFFVSVGGFEIFSDEVILNTSEEYSNLTNKTKLMYEWITSMVEPPDLIIRLDDDIYIKADLFIQRWESLVNGMHWWGSFTHTAINENSESFFLPLFARGFAYVVSHAIVAAIISENLWPDKVEFEDVAMGVSVQELVVKKGWKIAVDDYDEDFIAMNANCDGDYSSINPHNTFIIHHINSEQIKCMHIQTNFCKCV